MIVAQLDETAAAFDSLVDTVSWLVAWWSLVWRPVTHSVSRAESVPQ